jgi:hypothetical protein
MTTVHAKREENTQRRESEARELREQIFQAAREISKSWNTCRSHAPHTLASNLYLRRPRQSRV